MIKTIIILASDTGKPINRPLSCGGAIVGSIPPGGSSNIISIALGGKVLPVNIHVEFPLHIVIMG